MNETVDLIFTRPTLDAAVEDMWMCDVDPENIFHAVNDVEGMGWTLDKVRSINL